MLYMKKCSSAIVYFSVSDNIKTNFYSFKIDWDLCGVDYYYDLLTENAADIINVYILITVFVQYFSVTGVGYETKCNKSLCREEKFNCEA